MFPLHPAFERASAPLTALPLSEARLHLDARFPWIVLVPRIPGATALEDLTTEDHGRLMAEILVAGRAVRAMGAAADRPVARLNVGVLGNITPQLHVHVIGRRSDDPAWPGPAWGHGAATPYTRGALATAIAAALAALRG
ncbi:MAG TPA: HIT domain-containing protein [Caulobacteraceae bacterium]